jgi:hypothetical protein
MALNEQKQHMNIAAAQQEGFQINKSKRQICDGVLSNEDDGSGGQGY